jgi:hypothetical protein
MFGFLAAITLLAGGAPCDASLPRGPAVPAPIVLSTDCGWFRLETDGDVDRLPVDWYATHKQPWKPRYGAGFGIRRTKAGRYLLVRDNRVIWRSAGLYFNEAGSVTFGPNAFAFDSYGRRGVFLTDLRSPERLVLRGRGVFPIGFTSDGELLAAGPRMISVVSRDGTVLRRLPFRRSTSYAFDEGTETLYFVTPGGVLSAAHGAQVRRIGKVRVRGWIGLLGRRLLTLTQPGRVTVLRRDDGTVVATTRWHAADLDAGVAVSDDGQSFSFRLTKPSGMTSVYVLRAGEHRARRVYRHRFRQVGCGYAVDFAWHGSSFLYRSVDGRGVAETAILAANGSVTRLTPLLRALPRQVRTTPGNAHWEADFRS